MVDYARIPDTVNGMVDCPYFKTNFLDLTQDFVQDVMERDSFSIYLCVAGAAKVTNDWGSTSIKKGETLLVSASSTGIEIATEGSQLLEVTI